MTEEIEIENKKGKMALLLFRRGIIADLKEADGELDEATVKARAENCHENFVDGGLESMLFMSGDTVGDMKTFIIDEFRYVANKLGILKK
jgi:hypothetical protein